MHSRPRVEDTPHNPASYGPKAGFYDGASLRVGEMLLCRDVSRPPERRHD